MTTQIDFKTLPANVPVLCIPRVYANISEQRIRRIFEELNMGTLERIDIVSKKSDKGEKFNRVFVNFRRWNDTENSKIARQRLLNGKEIKIIYDDPWFWKISAYREAERKPSAPQNVGQRKPTLQFDSDEERGSNFRRVSSYRRRPDAKLQEDKKPAEVPKIQPRTPNCSPPRERQDHVDEGLNIDYGDIIIPFRKKNFNSKHLKIQVDREEDKVIGNL
jgi:hypothetical protein